MGILAIASMIGYHGGVLLWSFSARGMVCLGVAACAKFTACVASGLREHEGVVEVLGLGSQTIVVAGVSQCVLCWSV